MTAVFKPFLVTFIQVHLDFRMAELNALGTLEGVELQYDASALSRNSPFLVVKIKSREEAKRLVRRAILIKEIAELWVEASSMEELLQKTRDLPSELHASHLTKSFKFEVNTFGLTLSVPEQVSRIERFSFLPYTGPVNLKSPDITFSLYEDWLDNASMGIPMLEKPMRLFFGVWVAGGDRGIIKTYNLKKRGYIGITSMDAELSLIMSNQAIVKPGSFVLDPFVGTGSFLFTTAHYGAFSMGSDIDGRQIRGKDGKDIITNAQQYNLMGRILGNVVCDIAHHPWREVEFWDAIICDPPYGVRAGAKKIAVNPKLPPRTTIINSRTGQKKTPSNDPIRT